MAAVSSAVGAANAIEAVLVWMTGTIVVVVVDDGVDVVWRNGQTWSSRTTTGCGTSSGADDFQTQRVVEPWMGQERGQRRSDVSVHSETLAYQILTFWRYSISESQFCIADLVIALKWYVAADHVKQEDTKRPDSSHVTIVSIVSDPFRGCIDSSSIKVSVNSILQMST